MSEHTKKVRVTVDLNPEDHSRLEKISMTENKTRADIFRKAIRLMEGLQQETICLHTPGGDKIPTSIIFS